MTTKKNPPITSTELDTAALAGMLADLERTAGRDYSLPMLRGLVLYTETGTGGTNRLYGCSTNRFLLGMAWEPTMGALPGVFLDLEAVALLRRMLDHAPKGTPVTLTYLNEITSRESDGFTRDAALEVTAPGVAQLLLPLHGYDFPRMEGLVREHVRQDSTGHAVLQPQFVAALAQIGRRRRERLRFTFGDPRKASVIDIGARYRAMLMPVAHEGDGEGWRYALPGRLGDYGQTVPA